jgi:hypothetical protein
MKAIKLSSLRQHYRLDEWEIVSPDSPETATIEDRTERERRILMYAEQARTDEPLNYEGE